MPAYDYCCKTCGLEFEEILPISRRKEPCRSPCDYCQHLESTCQVEIVVRSPFIGDSMRIGIKKPDKAFNDKLKEIKKSHYKSNVNIYE